MLVFIHSGYGEGEQNVFSCSLVKDVRGIIEPPPPPPPKKKKYVTKNTDELKTPRELSLRCKDNDTIFLPAE